MILQTVLHQILLGIKVPADLQWQRYNDLIPQFYGDPWWECNLIQPAKSLTGVDLVLRYYVLKVPFDMSQVTLESYYLDMWLKRVEMLHENEKAMAEKHARAMGGVL